MRSEHDSNMIAYLNITERASAAIDCALGWRLDASKNGSSRSRGRLWDRFAMDAHDLDGLVNNPVHSFSRGREIAKFSVAVTAISCS